MGLVAAGASAGMGAAGSLINGFSQASSYKAQARQAEANARVAASEGDAAVDQGYLSAQRDYQEGAQRLGAQRAQMAANGIALDSGSALDVQQATGRNTGMTVASDLYNANTQSWAARNQATGFNNEARSDRYSAGNAIIGGATNAVLTAGSAFASKWDDLFKSKSKDDASDFSGAGVPADKSFKV